jgi:hypothetical protein
MIGGLRDGPKKRSYDRKSEGGAEAWRKQKKAKNADRFKQTWVGGKVVEGGHWERIVVISPAS